MDRAPSRIADRLEVVLEKNRSLYIDLIESKRASRLRTEHAFRPFPGPLGLGGKTCATKPWVATVKSPQRFFTRSAYCLGRKQRPAICQPPAPQTNFSTSPRVTSLNQVPIYSISISQFSNHQTSLCIISILSRISRPAAFQPLCTVPDSVQLGPMIAISSGWCFYDRRARHAG